MGKYEIEFGKSYKELVTEDEMRNRVERTLELLDLKLDEWRGERTIKRTMREAILFEAITLDHVTSILQGDSH